MPPGRHSLNKKFLPMWRRFDRVSNRRRAVEARATRSSAAAKNYGRAIQLRPIRRAWTVAIWRRTTGYERGLETRRELARERSTRPERADAHGERRATALDPGFTSDPGPMGDPKLTPEQASPTTERTPNHCLDDGCLEESLGEVMSRMSSVQSLSVRATKIRRTPPRDWGAITLEPQQVRFGPKGGWMTVQVLGVSPGIFATLRSVVHY